jgi:hypothetical protein
MPPSLARTVRATFARVDIAEEEIQAAKLRFPACASEIHAAFACLCPTDPIRDLSEDVFRFHCREILERVAKAQDVRPGTTAEVLGFLADASQLAPPSRFAAFLYQRLFARLLPDRLTESCGGIAMPEPERFEKEEVLSLEGRLRRRLATDRGAI